MIDPPDVSRGTFRDVCTAPEIITDRCVHSLIGAASCRACVDSCPHDAWMIDEEQLGINTARCDGCDLCVPACPQGAIASRISPELRTGAGRTLAMFACEPSSVQTDTGKVPCLHSVGLNMLMLLYRQGLDTIVTCSADCDHCLRRNAPRLNALIKSFNGFLRNRQLPEIQYQGISANEWNGLLTELSSVPAGRPISRRQFFLQTTNTVIEGKDRLKATTTQWPDEFQPAGTILPSQSPGQMVPFLPQIESTRCDACNACIKLCPHNALVFEQGLATYHIEPDHCSGCGICIDVCEQDAVSVRTWAIPELTEIALVAGRCGDCGVPYFMPAANPAQGGLCRICAKRRQHQLLYQVLD